MIWKGHVSFGLVNGRGHRPDGAPQAERGATGRGASRQVPALAPRAAVGLTRSCRR